MLRRPPRSTRTDTLFPTRRSSDLWFVDLTRETRHDGQAGPGGLHAITRPAIDAVESGRIRFVPDNWKTTYFQWLNNIQDWCISRQLWWGHRIPAWFRSEEHTSELQSLMRISYAVFCLKKKNTKQKRPP